MTRKSNPLRFDLDIVLGLVFQTEFDERVLPKINHSVHEFLVQNDFWVGEDMLSKCVGPLLHSHSEGLVVQGEPFPGVRVSEEMINVPVIEEI